jgi:hypothetical protein
VGRPVDIAERLLTQTKRFSHPVGQASFDESDRFVLDVAADKSFLHVHGKGENDDDSLPRKIAVIEQTSNDGRVCSPRR